jgi:hypothetical protein
MTTPGTYPLTIYRGDSYAWQFHLWDDDAKTAPTDLADAVAAAEIRTTNPDNVALECSITAPNIIDVVLPADDSSNLAPGNGSWDLQVTYASGGVTTVLAGMVMVTPDVTDAGAAS